MSGAYGNRFLDTGYLQSYEQTVRKIFKDPEQAAGYFSGIDADIKGRYLKTFLPARDVLGRAARRGLQFFPYDPFLEAIPIGAPREVAALDPASFPLTLRFDITGSDRATESIEITLKEPVSEADAEWLRQELAALSLERVPRTESPPPADAFSCPVAVHRFSRWFGAYLGIVAEARPEARDRFVNMLGERLDGFFPQLERTLGNAASLGKFAGIKKPLPVEKALRKGENPTGRFNPYGPLHDDAWRTTAECGRVAAILLFAPEKSDPFDWDYMKVAEWLETFFDSPQAAGVRKERAYHQVLYGPANERQDALRRLEGEPSGRLLRLLVRLVEAEGEGSSLREEAAKILSRQEAPERRGVFLRIAERQSPPELLRLAEETLADYPEEEVVQALLGLWRNKKLEWNSRYPARDAARKIAEKSSALRPRIEEGLREE